MQRRQHPNAPTLGNLLRAARKAKKLTYRELAAQSETSGGFIADLEMGRRHATEDVISRIAKALGLAPRILLRANALERIQRLQARAEEIRRAAR